MDRKIFGRSLDLYETTGRDRNPAARPLSVIERAIESRTGPGTEFSHESRFRGTEPVPFSDRFDIRVFHDVLRVLKDGPVNLVFGGIAVLVLEDGI
jgi:hypothetical protein